MYPYESDIILIHAINSHVFHFFSIDNLFNIMLSSYELVLTNLYQSTY